MNKKTFLNISAVLLGVLYFFSLIVNARVPLFGLQGWQYWLPTLVLFMGFYIAIKTILFAGKSNMLIASLLCLSAVFLFVLQILALPFANWWSVWFAVFAICFLLVGVVYKNMHDIKLAIAFVLLGLPFGLYSFAVLSFWYALLVFVGSLYFNVLVFVYLPEHMIIRKKRRND